MDEVAKFLGAMFTLSVGVERIVEILKNFWDSFTGRPKARTPRRSGTLQLLAAAIGTGVVFYIGPELFVPGQHFEELGRRIVISLVLGAMSSGGSAFWNDLISIVTAMKNVREQTAAVLAETKAKVQGVEPAAPVTPGG